MAAVLEQQRREARPTAVLFVLAAIFLLPMGACGTVGAWKLHTAFSPIVPLSSVSQLEPGGGMPAGTYVAVDVEAAQDGCRLGWEEGTWTDYSIANAPHVFLATRTLIGAGSTHVVGQLCDTDSPFLCEIPNEQTRARMRAIEGREHEPRLMLVSGEVPSNALWESAVGLGLAAACLLSFLFAARTLLRAAREPGRAALTRTLTLTGSPDEIRATLRAGAGPLRRIAEDSPERICVLLGMPVARVLLVGFHTTERIPLRVDVEFSSAAPYRGGIAKLTVRQLLPSSGHLAEALSAATRVAVEHAAEWVQGAAS